MDVTGIRNAACTLSLNTYSNTCTQGRKRRVTHTALILLFHSVGLLNLAVSMVSERRFVREQYAWITYTPINDARGILHTI